MLLSYRNREKCPLTVQAKVLRERLSAQQLQTVRHKVAYRPRVFNRIATGKALIGRIEERQQLATFNHLAYALPLVSRRIASRWIMGTCLQHDNGTGWRRLQIGQHAIDVNGVVGRVPVAVLPLIGKASSGENLFVVICEQIEMLYLQGGWISSVQALFRPDSYEKSFRRWLFIWNCWAFFSIHFHCALLCTVMN